MSTHKMFVIPIYLLDLEEEDERDHMKDLGVESEDPLTIKQTAFHTIFIDSYWIDPDKNRHTGIKDIVFYVNGISFRTPFSQKIINEVIHPAMMIRAGSLEEEQFITGPN